MGADRDAVANHPAVRRQQARLSAYTAVDLADGDLRWYVHDRALQAAPVALRAAAAALGLAVTPAPRWQRSRRREDGNATAGLADGVSPAIAGLARYGEPGWVALNADLYPPAPDWGAARRDALLHTIGHEAAHHRDHQALTPEVFAAEPQHCPHVEKACDLVGEKLLPRLRAAVAEAEAGRVRVEETPE